MYIAVLSIALLVGYSTTQDANCDFYVNVVPGVTSYVYSPNYPSSYPLGVTCRWQATCSNNTYCRLDCTDIDLPETTGCNVDRLLISRTGDPTLTQAEYYCGYGTLTAESVGQRISIGLITSTNSPGGRFYCELTAVQRTPPTPPPTPTCTCGYQRLDRIVGGVTARPGEFPMMAGLIYVSQRQIRCGATIIDRKYVLTAAHCVINRTVNDLGVVVGEFDTSTGADSPATQVFPVASYLTHPMYREANYDYDIAIVTIAGEMVYSEYVGPACLPFKFGSYDFAGTQVTAMGWGTTSPGGPTSNVLMKVNLDVINQGTCQLRVPTLTSRQMCTYTRGRDACQDDSGGPLLYRDSVTGLLFHVGIVSYGRFCASADPGVNTRITALLNWIVTNAPAQYCVK
ncbi:venom serine protease 34-like [Melitaea cinxia]|uniref:venom serine protease 34-like n=1 Tax=Melitaea cinxia TaxID=113334 RepID=UPI001E2740F2|nr:venom serine protease 34-like [Melitaea cinxia]